MINDGVKTQRPCHLCCNGRKLLQDSPGPFGLATSTLNRVRPLDASLVGRMVDSVGISRASLLTCSPPSTLFQAVVAITAYNTRTRASKHGCTSWTARVIRSMASENRQQESIIQKKMTQLLFFYVNTLPCRLQSD